jgi:transposase
MLMVDRTNSTRVASSQSSYSLMEFMEAFPDDEACLEWLWRTRFSPDGKCAYCSKCEQEREFRRYPTKQRRFSWTCTGCGRHVSATTGTIYEGSATALHLWFYAGYLITSTRCGISAKQLERELGVTYKTAWRILNKLRNIVIGDDIGPPSGDVDVEVDEGYGDGKPDKQQRQGRPATGDTQRSEAAKLPKRSRATVFAAVERGGRIKATGLPSRRGTQLKNKVIEWAGPESIITDEWLAYKRLERQFIDDSQINHGASVYVEGSTHTNTIAEFFCHLKPSIKGTYRQVSHKWLQGYLNVFVWCRNARPTPEAMFDQLLRRAACAPVSVAE